MNSEHTSHLQMLKHTQKQTECIHEAQTATLQTVTRISHTHTHKHSPRAYGTTTSPCPWYTAQEHFATHTHTHTGTLGLR